MSVLSPNGTRLRSFGTRGFGPGQFRSPRGIAADDEENILVVDYGNNRIQKFTGDGQFLASVGTEGTGQLQFINPMDIAFNSHNKKLYVVDNKNHRIQVLNSDLTLFDVIDKKRGSQNGDITHPWGVTCDSTGNVYVAARGDFCIRVFTASGEFLRKFGRRGSGDGEVHSLVGVAVDSKGKLFVVERDNHRISVFTTKGEFVKSFGQHGTKPGEFNNPMWLAVDDYDVLYMCDKDNGRVQIF